MTVAILCSLSSPLHLELGDFTLFDFLELLIGLTTQKVTVTEGNSATLCVNFSSEFVTNFEIKLENTSINDPGKSVHGEKYF